MEWQIDALEFSQANLEAGEIAGLLAFGFSYEQAIFTGGSQALSIAFLRAAQQCGADLIPYNDFIADVFENEDYIRHVTQQSGMRTEDMLALEADLAARCQ
jgi:hypothetical protein